MTDFRSPSEAREGHQEQMCRCPIRRCEHPDMLPEGFACRVQYDEALPELLTFRSALAAAREEVERLRSALSVRVELWRAVSSDLQRERPATDEWRAFASCAQDVADMLDPVEGT